MFTFNVNKPIQINVLNDAKTMKHYVLNTRYKAILVQTIEKTPDDETKLLLNHLRRFSVRILLFFI